MKCISIHLTDLCNSECSFCVVGSPLYTKDTIRRADIEGFLHENAGKFDVVNLHGGEPTIYPRFFETIELIRQLGYREIHLQTNGVRLAEPGMLDRLKAANVSKLIVSLHGADAETQEAQTFHRRSFDRIVTGMRMAHAEGIHIRTNTVVTYQNLLQLPDIARLACDIGVDHVNISNMHPVGSARIARATMMPMLTEILPPLDDAIDIVRGAERTVTLEGFPHCVVTGNGRDELHLHNEYRAIRMLMRGEVLEDYDDFMRFEMRIQGEKCSKCPGKSICGGVYGEYVEFFGWDEIRPLTEAEVAAADPDLAVVRAPMAAEAR
ncbi:radical SAM protein [Erythrobacter sp. JK5]|uniref:radical SAM protein n=1 Tax=Erythrobacter sp. JK5 TaxID=2829500 RepID=UPI001BAB69A6|nr:radical SAM protein [Erythrobacter sp. JK5]QUL37961.1 radical SAM protein [Erythrobacter sp. JK5]